MMQEDGVDSTWWLTRPAVSKQGIRRLSKGYASIELKEINIQTPAFQLY